MESDILGAENNAEMEGNDAEEQGNDVTLDDDDRHGDDDTQGDASGENTQQTRK